MKYQIEAEIDGKSTNLIGSFDEFPQPILSNHKILNEIVIYLIFLLNFQFNELSKTHFSVIF